MFSFNLPVVLYIRVSSDKQKEAHTIEGQLDALTAYCQRENITPLEIYKDDGESGDLPFLSRPGGTRLLNDAKSGKFVTVLVYLYDRFSRSVYEGLEAARLLKESGATPYSIMEPFDITTPHGQYMFVNSLNNAQLFKAQFLERTRDGSRRKARAGAWVGGPPPYGYRVEGRGKNEMLHLVINDASEVACDAGRTEADVVRWIFALCVSGYSNYRIAVTLNAHGIPTRGGSSKGWHPATISRILNNTSYKGVHQFGRINPASGPNPREHIIERPCPIIVEPDLWEKAQHALAKNQQMSLRPTDKRYLLRGLIRCEICGKNFGGQKWHTRRYKDHFVYICRSNALPLSDYTQGHRKQGMRCPAGILPGNIETMIWSEILEMLNNPEEAAKQAEDAAKQKEPEPDAETLQSELKKVECALSAKEGERSAVLGVFRRGRITAPALDAQLDDIDKEEALLKESRQSLAQRLTGLQEAGSQTENVILYLRTLKERLDLVPSNDAVLLWETKRHIIEWMVNKITVQSSAPAPGKRRGIPTVVIHYSYGAYGSRTDTKPF